VAVAANADIGKPDKDPIVAVERAGLDRWPLSAARKQPF
jgi:hypothetical protein